jgi:endothelin-converting enzyme/putative endopeptidase
MLVSAAVGQTSAGSAPLPKLSHFDASIVNHDLDPCVDFYKYVCSNWQAANPIPEDQVAWGTGSNLRLWNETVLRNTMEEASKPSPGRTAVQQKIGDYWYACMDEAAIEKSGMKPLQSQLDKIRGMKDKSEIAGMLAQIHMKMPDAWNGGDNETAAPMLGFSSTIDFNNAQLMVAGVDQGGFAMGGKDYYLSDNAHLTEVRGKYAEHIQKLFALTGENDAKAKADAATVLRMETAMAKAAMDAVSRRDPAKVNNVMNLQQVQALTPSFRWNDYLAAVKAPTPQHYIVSSPDFFKALETMLQNEPLENWKTYLSYWVIDRNSPYMGQAFQEASFEFWNKTMLGQKAQLPRWRRCVRWADRDLGEALGQAYVAQAFPPDDKVRTAKMIDNIQVAMGQDIQQVDWMAPETKQKGEEKLHAVMDKIGYPDTWRDYSSVTIVRDGFGGDVQAAAVFEYERQLNKIGKPVDRKEWGMTPPTINAYENPQNNTINFPAGILHPPYFDPAADDSVNYGAVGMVMGHELTHGFDDEGRKFDAQGNLKDWWTEQDAKAYDERGKCISDEYTAEVAELGVKTNGLLTQGEDTADNGGARLAYMAMTQSLKAQGKSLDDKGADGLTAPQRFFVAHAFEWCANLRPELARNRITTDPHSLPQFRVNKVESNMPEFWQAFGCKQGQPMVRANACRVW